MDDSATIRNETGDARPPGKAISKAEINLWTIVLQSVTKRAMPVIIVIRV